MSVYTYMNLNIYMHFLYECICMYVSKYVLMYEFMHVFMYVCICMCVFQNVCTYAYKNAYDMYVYIYV